MPTKDVPIKLTDGEERVLRFDWGALCRFEEEFGYSVLSIATKIGTGEISFLDITRAIWVGLLHEEKPLSLNKIKKLLTNDDFFEYMEAVAKVISESIPEEKDSAKKV